PSTSKLAEPPLLNLASLVHCRWGLSGPLHEQARGASPAQPRFARALPMGLKRLRPASRVPRSKLADPDEVRSKSIALLSSVLSLSSEPPSKLALREVVPNSLGLFCLSSKTQPRLQLMGLKRPLGNGTTPPLTA